MTKVRTTLVAARALVERGWTKGAYEARRNAGRCFCALGALQQVTETSNALDVARVALLKATGDEFGSVVAWNDAPDRTQAEVLAAFDKAIAEVGP